MLIDTIIDIIAPDVGLPFVLLEVWKGVYVCEFELFGETGGEKLPDTVKRQH